MKNFKYLANLPAALGFLLMLAVFVILFGGRTIPALRFEWINRLLPGFYSHISNGTISYILCSATGLVWLLMGVRFRLILWLGLFFIAVNFVYELFIPVLNTRDVTDAWYGTAGTLVAMAFLFLVSRAGLQDNPGYDSGHRQDSSP